MLHSVMKPGRAAGRRGSRLADTLAKLSAKLPMADRCDEMKETVAYNPKPCDFVCWYML